MPGPDLWLTHQIIFDKESFGLKPRQCMQGNSLTGSEKKPKSKGKKI